jgi:hypothetical protein
VAGTGRLAFVKTAEPGLSRGKKAWVLSLVIGRVLRTATIRDNFEAIQNITDL